jgi:hypothetical protein
MLVAQTPISNFQLVNIIVPSVGTKYFFPDLPNLRNAYISKISNYNYTYMQKDQNNISLYLAPQIALFLTLVRDNDEVYQRIPLQLLNSIWWHPVAGYATVPTNAGLDFDFQQFNFSKSYVEYATAWGTTPNPGESICFGIFYKK